MSKPLDTYKELNKFIENKQEREEAAEQYFKEYYSIHKQYPTLKEIKETILTMSRWLHKDKEQLRLLKLTRQALNLVGLETFIESMEV